MQCYPDHRDQETVNEVTRQYWKSYPHWFTEYDFTFDESEFPHFGWYPAEKVGEELWAWSGPENISTVDLPLDRTINLRVRFPVTHHIDSDILESLELHIDDNRIHLIHIEEDGVHIFTGIIPAEPGKKNVPTRLSFHVNRTAYPPGMTAESSGARLLGIALSGIEITQLE